MQPVLWSLHGLSVELGRDRKALARALEGLKPDEETRRGRGVDRKWRLKRVVSHLFEQTVEGETDFENQRERLAAAQAEKVEMENAVRRGLLADVTEVQRVWSEHILAASRKLLAVADKMGPQLTNVSDPVIVKSRLRSEIHVALVELAESGHDGASGSAADPAESSAELDRKSVV